MGDLHGKVALVTGGGRGLGAAICRRLGQEGALIVVADVRLDLAEPVAADINGSGGHGMALRCDVADAAEAEAAVQQTLASYGRLDILINNAGVDVTRALDELDIAEWDCVLGVNLRGPFLMSRFAFPVLKQQGHGHIINIVSTAAKRAWAKAAAYHASKWGLLGLSQAMHVEGRQHHVKVTAIVNGGMRTPFLLERFPDIDVSTLQDPRNVAETIRFVLTLPEETVIPELMVLPMAETSWP